MKIRRPRAARGVGPLLPPAPPNSSKRGTCALLAAALFGGVSGLLAAPAAKPNIVVFISDDHTVRDSSAYGAKDISTPNMERLAAAGMRFDRTFAVSPSCAPSRAAMLTGLMPARNGAEPNHAAPRGDLKKLPAYLQQVGYEVVAFGKVGHYQQTTNYGFDLAKHCGFHEDIAIPAALDWLRARQSDKPLCLFVGCNWPHVPWPRGAEGHDPAGLSVPANHVDTEVTRRARARYYAAITRMDKDLGRIYDLARDKFGTNLFFLHFSDQGAQWPFGKWCLYDDGIRTPMLAVWPGHIAPGSRTEAMVSLVDALPTLVEVAGGKSPQGLDARSFLGVALGKTARHRDRIFATHSGDGNFNVYPSRCLRDERWKYILNLHPEFEFNSHVTKAKNGGALYWRSWVETAQRDPDAATKVQRYRGRPREELYDVVSDPWEQHNLAGSPAQAGRLRAMRAELEQWMKDQGDKQTVFGEPTLLTQHGSGAEKH